jgi:3-oxoacyl-[acyl-carrier-protein] synthase II
MEFDWLEERNFKSRIGAPVEDLDPTQFMMTKREANLLDPAAQFTIAATAMALEDAGLSVKLVNEKKNQYSVDGIDSERAGVIIGTGIGGLHTIEAAHDLWASGKPITGTFRYSLPMLIPNAMAAQAAIKFGLHGECKAVATACAAGTMAIGDAYRLVRDGELDLAVTGGVDRTLSDFDGYGLVGFDLLRTLSTRNSEPEKASRPFDTDRDGFVLGEGAGVLVIERKEHAVARGARIYAEIAGYASTCDAHSMMQLHPSGDQMVRVMKNAIASSDLSHDDIRYVNAHGTSTRLNDPREAEALHRVFGKRIMDVVVNSTKAMTGHCIGASGAIETITTALSLARGVIHRCVNLEIPDPEIDLVLPLKNDVNRAVAAISNSFGFGGHNATLVVKEA